MRIEPFPFPPHRRTLVSLAVAVALGQYGVVLAAPVGHQVVAGQVTVTRPDVLQTVINQASQAAIVNWQQFSIGATEHVDIRQPNAASVLLNRVIGNNPSEIYGRLSANGQVFLVNPNGVLFGRNSQVSVGGLVASTLDIANDDFLAGRFQFAGNSGAAVSNQGTLQAAERGTVALLGGRVNNDGTISAQLGTAALVAGEKIALDFQGDGLTKIRVDQGAVAAMVANRGMIIADGGQAVMSASAAQALADTVLNQQGTIRARSLVERDGKIVLDGGAHGVTLNSGTLDASGGAGLKGGTVNLLGHHVGLVGQAVVDASGHNGGGGIFVGGGVQGANPLLRNAAATFAGPQATLRADALGAGNGGTVVLWSDGATRMFGAASARGGAAGGDGGFIETSGKFVDVSGALIDAAGPRGNSGNWLLDPYDVNIISSTPTGPFMGTSPNFVSDSTQTNVQNVTIANLLSAGTSVTVTTGAGGTLDEGNINVDADIIKTGGGDATLTLNAINSIFINAQIRSTVNKLHLDLNADSDADLAGNIQLSASSVIRTNGGNVRMFGQNDAVNGFAVGSSSDFSFGVNVGVGSVIDTTAAGVAGGDIMIRGKGLQGIFGGTGVALDASSVITSGGAISITGVSGDGGGYGVVMDGQTISTTNGGAIDIRGLALPDANPQNVLEGILGGSVSIFTSGGPGNIVISGQSSNGTGLSLSDVTLGSPGMTGDITVRAYATDPFGFNTQMLVLPALIQTTGMVNLRPGGVSASGALTANDNVVIDISPLAATGATFGLSQPNLELAIPSGPSTLVIGGSTHTGAINVNASAPFGAGWNVTLQNGGAGSAGINLNNGLDVTGRQLTLSSGGSVAEAGPIVADSLLLHGTQAGSNFTLVNTGNSVNNLAATFDQQRGAGPTDGDVRLRNSASLQIGPLSAFGMDSATNLRQSIGALSSAIAGDFHVQTDVDLSVAGPLNMLGSAALMNLTAANDLNVTGTITRNADGGVTMLTASRDVNVPGAIDITSPNSTLFLRALRNLNVAGTMSFAGSGADLVAQVDVDATIGGAISMAGAGAAATMNVANNLTVTGPINMAGADAVLTLGAGNILSAGGTTTMLGDRAIASLSGNTLGAAGDIVMSGSAANLTLNAGVDLTTSGAIAMGNDAVFAFNAGRDLTVAGDVSTTGGTHVQALNAGRDIMLSSGANFFSSTPGGALHLDFNADSDSVNGGAIALTGGSSVATNGGALRLFGQSNALTGFASGSSFRLPDGILIDFASIDTAGGALSMRGQGVTFPVGTGPITNFIGDGVAMSGATVGTGSGPVSVFGIGGLGGNGVSLNASTVATSAGGAIDMRARSGPLLGAAPGNGLVSVGSTIATGGGAADISLSGESIGGAGMAFSGANAIGTSGTSGNIILRAFNTGTGPTSGTMLSLGGTIATTGVVNLRAGGVTATGTLTEQPAAIINIGGVSAPGQLALSQAALDAAIQPGTAGVVIGSSAHSGTINVTSVGPFSGNYDLTLQNDAPGSGGINLANGLTLPGRLLTLSSGGAVTQGGPIVAGRLLLRGTQPSSSFNLMNAGNTVANVSANFLQAAGVGANDGNVSFYSSGNLQVGPLAGVGFDSATNLAQNFSSAGTVIAGDLVLSSGGDLTVMEDISMLAGGSAVTLNAARDITLAQDTSIGLATPSGTLQIDFNADSDSAGGGAIVIAPLASIVTNGGSVRLYGQSDAANGYASGSSSLSRDGVSIAGTIDAGPGGSVAMRGRGFSGSTPAANGVAMNGATISSGSGPIAVTGLGGLGGTGVRIEASQIATGIGALDIRGRAGADTATSAGSGVVLSSSGVRASAGATAISGEAFGGSGVAATGTSTIGGASSSGNILLRALNTSTARTLDVGGTIQTSGLVNLRPGGVSATGALTESTGTVINIGSGAAAGEFSMTQDVLVSGILAGTPSVVVGSAAQTGAINVLASAPLGGTYDLSLQNGGAGSGGINLYNGLSIPGRMLTLSSGGNVTQGAAIVAGRLLLHGTGAQSSFQLANPANAVSRFSARFEVLKGTAPLDGDVNFASGGNLEIGPMTGLGYDGATGLAQSFVAANAVIAGDIVAQAGGNMVLQQNVSTLGSDITLVAGGVLLNPANATLNPGGGGRWRVFADTWVGEVDGGLTGTAPTPNYYNCAYGAACVNTLPAANNYFVYRQQPVINIALVTPAQTRVYGTANPPFPYTVGALVNGDTLDRSLSGAYAVAAPNANVGTYAVTGAFTSPNGYFVTAAPGTLSVTPATLTYTATPASRSAGTVNPTFGGTVTGLVNGDTLGGAATGSLSFTSAATPASPSGLYAVNGSGLTATNYVLQQALANATALEITGALIMMPSIGREVSLASSDLYGKNYGTQRACVGSGPLAGAGGAGDANDTLAMEWARVRETPNLSNCIGLAQRYSCGDF